MALECTSFRHSVDSLQFQQRPLFFSLSCFYFEKSIFNTIKLVYLTKNFNSTDFDNHELSYTSRLCSPYTLHLYILFVYQLDENQCACAIKKSNNMHQLHDGKLQNGNSSHTKQLNSENQLQFEERVMHLNEIKVSLDS